MYTLGLKALYSGLIGIEKIVFLVFSIYFCTRFAFLRYLASMTSKNSLNSFEMTGDGLGKIKRQKPHFIELFRISFLKSSIKKFSTAKNSYQFEYKKSFCKYQGAAY